MENVLSCLIEWNICRCSQCSLWALLNSIPVVLSTTLPHHWTGVYVAEYSIETVCYKAKLQEQFVHEVFYAFSIHPVSCTILDSIWGYCKNCLRCCTVGLITWPHDCKVNFLSSWLCLCTPDIHWHSRMQMCTHSTVYKENAHNEQMPPSRRDGNTSLEFFLLCLKIKFFSLYFIYKQHQYEITAMLYLNPLAVRLLY